MSFIRYGQEGAWYDIEPSIYVYNNGYALVGLRNTHPEFAEIAMRVLARSDRLDEDTLRECQLAFGEELGMNTEMVLE